MRRTTLNSAEAERIGALAFAWLAGDPERLGRFLGQTGAAVEDIGGLAASPEFLGFVLDFLMTDDEMVAGFAAAEGLDPAEVATARALLPGGDAPHWS